MGLTFASLVTYFQVQLPQPCDEESQYYCIRVVDESGVYGTTRTLVLDHMVYSMNHQSDAQLLITPYVHAMDELLERQFIINQVAQPVLFFAGGGAYTQPRTMAARYPDAHIEVAEIDPEVTRIANQRLFVDTSAMVVHDADARVVLHQLPDNRFDALVTDVFHDVAIPWHLTTVEYLDQIKRVLKQDGVYLLNVVDQFPDARLVKAMIKTLSTRFAHVQVWMEEITEHQTRLTYVLSANNNGRFPAAFAAQQGLRRQWFDVADAVASVGTPMQDIPLLTDNHAPVEQLVADLFHSSLGL